MQIITPPDFFVKAVWALLSVLLALLIYYLVHIGNNYIPDRKRIKISNSKALPIVGAIIGIYFIYYLFKKYGILSDLFFTIALSAALAYIFNPVVIYMESRGMKRIFAVILLYFIITGIIFILAFLVLPRTAREIGNLVESMPRYFTNIKNFVDNINDIYTSYIGELPPMFQGIEKAVIDAIGEIELSLGDWASKFFQGAVNSITKIVTLILTPILTFYFLVDKDVFIKKIKEIIPQRYKSDVLYLAGEIDNSVSKFIRGRVIMAISVGFATTVFLFLMGVEFAIVIGFITTIGDVIPYLGPFMAFVPAVIFAFISSPIKALWIAIFFVLLQWAENNLLGPKILGDSTGMHPLIILLAIIVGGGIMGVVGMILAVPFIAVGKIIFLFIKGKLKNPPQQRD